MTRHLSIVLTALFVLLCGVALVFLFGGCSTATQKPEAGSQKMEGPPMPESAASSIVSPQSIGHTPKPLNLTVACDPPIAGCSIDFAWWTNGGPTQIVSSAASTVTLSNLPHGARIYLAARQRNAVGASDWCPVISWSGFGPRTFALLGIGMIYKATAINSQWTLFSTNGLAIVFGATNPPAGLDTFYRGANGDEVWSTNWVDIIP